MQDLPLEWQVFWISYLIALPLAYYFARRIAISVKATATDKWLLLLLVICPIYNVFGAAVCTIYYTVRFTAEHTSNFFSNLPNHLFQLPHDTQEPRSGDAPQGAEPAAEG